MFILFKGLILSIAIVIAHPSVYANDNLQQTITLTVESSLNEKTFIEIVNYSLEIQAYCSPPECLLIGIGRSPTPILTFLELYRPSEYILNLPLSDISIQPSHLDRFPREQKIKIFEYFDSILAQAPNDYKKIALLDYTLSGKSLLTAQKLFDEYVEYKKINASVESIAISKVENSRALQILAEANKLKEPTNIILPKNSILSYKFYTESFDAFSKSKTYSIFKEDVLDFPPQVNNNHFRLYFYHTMKAMVQKFKKAEAKKCLENIEEVFTVLKS